MLNCYDFENVFGDESCPDVELDEVTCSQNGCGCVYLPFHKVTKHIEEIRSYCRERNKDQSVEFIVKEKIKHLSRLFDKETYQDFGYYSKAHFKTARTVFGDGTNFLFIGNVLIETVQICFDGKWIKPDFYTFENGYLKLNLCKTDTDVIVCPGSCHHALKIGWLHGCYTITGKFGSRFADEVIEGAILEQLLNDFRLVDPKKAVENQLYPQRPQFTSMWNRVVGLYRADQMASFC